MRARHPATDPGTGTSPAGRGADGSGAGAGTGSVAAVPVGNDGAAPLHPAPPDRPVWRAYLALTKPRIIELLLTTTIPTMILAAGGWPGTWPLVATVIGGYAAAGSANAYNMVIDRDIDALMKRTAQRPLVTGEVSVRAALVFATALGLGSVVWFALLLNPLSAALAAAAILLYVVFYTLVLKRRTEQNIVWGGVAGCMPVLIGWAAVTGDLAWAPVVLFGIIFFWTPPHYWPLSMRFKQDYAAAGVPMMPVNHSDTYVGKRIVGYAAATVACTLALVPVAAMGWLYAVAALAAGAWFLWSCVGLLRAADGPAKEGRKRAMSVFHGSITYLSVVFLAVALDPFLHLPVL